MVDPNQPNTLFYGSRTAGLWKSGERGLTWTQVTSFSSYVMDADAMSHANGGSPIGVEFVVFDTTVPTTGFVPSGNATQTIYVGVAPGLQGAGRTRIDDDAHRYGGVSAIVADTSVYGRVSMAGRGIDYNY